MKYRCLVCGQIIDTNVQCPICGAGSNKIVPYVEEVAENKNEKLVWADQHVIGVAKGLDEEVVQGCRDHFKGECSEVGIYLAMARQALREGYPELALLLEKIAEEESQHAAKFAELLGETLTSSTEDNVKKMLAGENGACKSKLAIAKRAKELGYDAVHDAVHEMAKDEQRHGAALEAMLARYFTK
ncbi:MAG: ferritin family protein [Bacilli bacterium]